jgi:hypothetical protein
MKPARRFTEKACLPGLLVCTLLILTSSTAKAQWGLQFNGSNQYVTFGASPELSTQTFTVEIWFKRTGTGTLSTTGTAGINIIPLVTKGAPQSEGNHYDANYVLGIRETNVLAADFEEGVGSDSVGLNHPISGTTRILNDVWYHAAATFSNGDFKLYLNGNLEADTSLGSLVFPEGASLQHSALATMLESDGTSTNGFFQGVLDEARIWNVAKSQAEIQAGMENEIVSGTGLLARWGLNEGAGTTASNSISGGVSGTLKSGALWVAPGAPLDGVATQYSLNVTTSGLGTVAKSPDQSLFNFGTVVQLTATPQAGYQFSGWSGDLSGSANPASVTMDASKIIVATFTGIPADSTVLIPLGATWKYLDNGSDQSTAWRNPEFDDAAWASGAAELGYGDSPVTTVSYGPDANNKYVTTYFRRTFTVSDPADYGALVIRLQRDDGAIVYLNGTEVRRDNMPAGTITFSTLAASAVSGADESAYYDSSITTTALVAGTNLIAVEIHQSSQTSSDISFDLALLGTVRNDPPAAPVLISPPNAGTNIAIPPTLSVSVSDPEGVPMTVSFYGRSKQQVTPGADFTIIALPDAQNYTTTTGTLAKFASQTAWCVNERVTRNIVFAAMEGDITNDNQDAQWQRAVTAMNTLESPSPGIPYAISLGNHDQLGGATTLYNTYFGVSRFDGRTYYGGHYGSDNNNSYQLFSASGMDFITIHLGSGDQVPPAAVLSWADGLLKSNASRRAIVVSHSIINAGNPGTFSSAGQAIFDTLKDNSNLFLMLCGHVPGEGRRTDTGTNGNTIHTILSDYQSDNEGNGWLRILTFSPANNRITVQSYSPYLSQYDWGGAGSFTLNYTITGGASCSLLGTKYGVPSASNTSIAWPSLGTSTEYEWYATVSDGTTTITGPAWTFTTGSGSSGTSETVDVTQTGVAYDFPDSRLSMKFGTLPAGGGSVNVVRHDSAPTGRPSLPGGASYLPLWFEITSALPANSFSDTVTLDVNGIAGFAPETNILYYSTSSGMWIPVGGSYNSSAQTFTFTTTHFTDYAFAGATSGAFDLYLGSSQGATSSATFRPNAGWDGGYPSRENDWSFTGTQPEEIYLVPDVGARFGACDVTVKWNSSVLKFVSVDFTGSVFSSANYSADTAGLGGGVHIQASLGSSNVTIGAGHYLAKIVLEVLKPGSSGLNVTGCAFQSFEPAPTSVFVTVHDALHGAYLADVCGASQASGDGIVNFNDLSAWSLSYWSGVPGYTGSMTNYKKKFDIGPTQDGYLFTRPIVDDKINFDDLLIFAMSYDISARHQIAKLGVQLTEPIEVSTGSPVIAGGETVIPVLLNGGVAGLRGLSLELCGQYGNFLGVEQGSLLNGRMSPPIMMSTQANGRLLVDFALAGSKEPCLSAAGEVMRLRFEGAASAGVSAVQARDAFNHPLPVKARSTGKGVPVAFGLSQNYPNPFNPTTGVRFQVPGVSQVNITVYDILGREVAVLANEVKQPGVYEVTFDGSNLASGLYVYRMTAGSFVESKKMVLEK